MRLPPGSFPWLVVNDMRLNWRRFTDMLGGASARTLLWVFVGGGVALHAAAWPFVRLIGPHVHGAEAAVAPLAGLLVCVFTWMIAQSLFGATRTLYARGDLDLLLGSPLPAGRIFAAKAAAIAASTLGSIAILTLPIAHVGALTDRPAWLGIYPALIGLVLIATSLALALAIGLFFLLGARRARTVTQLTGAVIGGAFVLGVQVVAMLPAPLRAQVTGFLEGSSVAQSGETSSPLWLPIEVIRGDLNAMLLLVALGVAIFAAVVSLLGGRFARASLAAAGASAGRGSIAAKRGPRFRAGRARNLRRKEWRLLARDPSLFAQLGLQIIYTVPVAVVLMRSEALPAALALAPTIVVVAAQVAASLAWLMVSGEDAPELIATAPVAAAAVDRAKLDAVAMPVLAVMVLPLAGLALVSLKAAIMALLFAAGAAASTALLNFWHPMPGNRRGMLRRHSQSKLVALVEHGLAVLWAIAVALAMLGSWLAVVPVAAAIGVLAHVGRRHAGWRPLRLQMPVEINVRMQDANNVNAAAR